MIRISPYPPLPSPPKMNININALKYKYSKNCTYKVHINLIWKIELNNKILLFSNFDHYLKNIRVQNILLMINSKDSHNNFVSTIQWTLENKYAYFRVWNTKCKEITKINNESLWNWDWNIVAIYLFVISALCSKQ